MQSPQSGHTTLRHHIETPLVCAGPYAFPPTRGKGGMGGERRPSAARLCTPTLPLPRLRGRGACVPIPRGLIERPQSQPYAGQRNSTWVGLWVATWTVLVSVC